MSISHEYDRTVKMKFIFRRFVRLLDVGLLCFGPFEVTALTLGILFTCQLLSFEYLAPLNNDHPISVVILNVTVLQSVTC